MSKTLKKHRRHHKKGGGLIPDWLNPWAPKPQSDSPLEKADEIVKVPIENAKEKVEELLPELKPVTDGNPLEGLPKSGGRRHRKTRRTRKSRKSRR